MTLSFGLAEEIINSFTEADFSNSLATINKNIGNNGRILLLLEFISIYFSCERRPLYSYKGFFKTKINSGISGFLKHLRPG